MKHRFKLNIMNSSWAVSFISAVIAIVIGCSGIYCNTAGRFR